MWWLALGCAGHHACTPAMPWDKSKTEFAVSMVGLSLECDVWQIVRFFVNAPARKTSMKIQEPVGLLRRLRQGASEHRAVCACLVDGVVSRRGCCLCAIFCPANTPRSKEADDGFCGLSPAWSNRAAKRRYKSQLRCGYMCRYDWIRTTAAQLKAAVPVFS
jgi:hypothetical protein